MRYINTRLLLLLLLQHIQKTVLPKPTVPMESGDSEGVPFASLEGLRLGIWQIGEGCRKVVT